MTTKEEILEKKFNNNSIRRVTYIPDIKGILEAMEEFAQQNLREELIKYTIWHQDKMFKCHALEEAIEHGMDEYLNNK